MSDRSTSAYADVPTSGSGPGVLVLHSWWGLTESVKDRCNLLADAGFTAMAPDLFGGRTATDDEHGLTLLHETDPNLLVSAVQSCTDALRRMPATGDGPIKVIGFSMGGSLGLWLSERQPDDVDGVVSFYASQSIDFAETRAAYQLHLAEGDPLVDVDELALMEASLGLADREVQVHRYPAAHNFAEPDTQRYDETAADLAWARTLEFLRDHS